MTDIYIILTLIALSSALYVEMRNRSLSIFLWAGIIVFFGFSHSLQMGSSVISNAVLNEASQFVCLFCVTYIMIRIVLKLLIKDNLAIKRDEDLTDVKIQRFTDFMYYSFLFSTLIYVVWVVLYAGSIGGISKQLIYSFRTSSFWVLLLNYLWQATVPVSLFYLIINNKKRFSICVFCIVAKSLISFTRTYLIELFVAITLYKLFQNKKINFNKILGGGIIAFSAIYGMYILRAFRYYYSFSDLGIVSWGELNQKAINFIETQSGDIFLSKFFYGLLQYENWVDGIVPGASYIRLLMLPIPSSVSFGLKPTDICITLGSFFGTNFNLNSVVSYTVTPTLFGDLYANFLWYGCIIGGLIWAFIVSLLDHIALKMNYTKRIFVIMLISSAYINIARGSVYNPFCNILYGIAIQFLLYEISIRCLKIKFVLYK